MCDDNDTKNCRICVISCTDIEEAREVYEDDIRSYVLISATPRQNIEELKKNIWGHQIRIIYYF